MPFIANTPDDRKAMLAAIGVNEQELLSGIPSSLLAKESLKLPEPLSEMEVLAFLDDLAAKNQNCDQLSCFLGAGAYDHFIPSAVHHILQRSEFYTAYTPYQPEVSQGTLQAIYEYQSMMCELTGMDVSNASLYDGGSALAEAILLASQHTRRKEILIAPGVHPHYVNIMQTYAKGQNIVLKTLSGDQGCLDLQDLKDQLGDTIAGVVVQHPNFFGYLEEMETISELTHNAGALFITSNDPISLAILTPPGQYGADIATGEGQGLGTPLAFGGPYLGLFTVKKELMRKLAGRVVGKTKDTKNRVGFVLTLQTREQHIRRERATSNICTNQGLNALAAAVYLALMGKNGLYKIAELCIQKSHYLAEQIAGVDGFSLKYDRPFFKEFVVQSEQNVSTVINKMRLHGILAGIPLGEVDENLADCFLCSVTEKKSREELDHYSQTLSHLS
jgi:glycine dehydrogenase subunit 1